MTISSPYAAARAPGKLILSGEHAVVYGQPALAMAVDRGASARLGAGSAPGLLVRCPALPPETLVPPAEVLALADRLDARFAEYQDGRRAIATVLEQPLNLLLYALSVSCREAGLGELPPLRLEVELELPAGSGMGSSAAVGLAVLAATRAWLGLPTDAEALERASLACERLQHGNPSGVDSYVCAHGGAVRFTRSSRQRMPLPGWPFLVIHTGHPEATTGECVAAVAAHRHQPVLWPAFGDTTQALEVALGEEDEQAIRHAVRRNHALLCRIGVVPRRVQAFVAAVEAAGGAAKVSGAGAIRGEAAGVLLALDSPTTRQLASDHGYPILECKGDPHGTVLLPGLGAR